MSRVQTSMNILESLKKKGEEAVKEGDFPGVTTFGGLVEHALQKVLTENHVEPEVTA